MALAGTFLAAQPVGAQGSGIPLEMGFGPTSVFPIVQGTPVYTVGDQLWVTSDFGGTVGIQLQDPAASGPGIQRTLQPGVPTLLHVFNSSDTPGVWTASVAGNSELVYFQLSPAVAASAIDATPVRFVGASLDLNVTGLAGVQFYDAEACALGGGDIAAAYVPVPSAFGGGEVEMDLANSTVEATGVGLGNVSFGFSLEMLHSFSFSSPGNPSVLLTRAAVVSSASPIVLSRQNSSATLRLQGFGTERPGVYELRALYQGSAGPSLSQTSVLVESDGTWVWLGGCDRVPVTTGNFLMQLPVGSSTDGWPRSVLVTYKVAGVEAYSMTSIGVGLSRATFLAEPWGAPLQGYQIRASSSNSVAVGISNSSVLVAFLGDSTTLDYSVLLGGEPILQGSSALDPFSASVIQVNLSALQVAYRNGGAPVEGGRIVVSAAGRNLTSATTGATGDAEFYLPPGTYDVTATGGGAPATQNVTLFSGTEGRVVLGTEAPSAQLSSFDYILGGAIVAGVVANLWLWARRRSFRRRLAGIGQAPR